MSIGKFTYSTGSYSITTNADFNSRIIMFIKDYKNLLEKFIVERKHVISEFLSQEKDENILILNYVLAPYRAELFNAEVLLWRIKKALKDNPNNAEIEEIVIDCRKYSNAL